MKLRAESYALEACRYKEKVSEESDKYLSER